MRAIAARLRPGQDLRRELLGLAERERVDAGWVLTCVGSLSRVTLRPAGTERRISRDGMFEIVSLVGTLSRGGGHLHLSASDEEGSTVGGHLVDGCVVRTTAEVVLGADERLAFDRRHDPETGYDELVVGERQPGRP
jgi:predicted DNA-binding protein with PD1-like motif